jgi:hypothetical protein
LEYSVGRGPFVYIEGWSYPSRKQVQNAFFKFPMSKIDPLLEVVHRACVADQPWAGTEACTSRSSKQRDSFFFLLREIIGAPLIKQLRCYNHSIAARFVHLNEDAHAMMMVTCKEESYSHGCRTYHVVHISLLLYILLVKEGKFGWS